MAESQNTWREKYRRALNQQEQLETTLTAQQTIFQRAVQNLTSAAEGQDADLDERLKAIRSSVKHNDVAAFDRMLKSLPRITEEVEQRQQQHWQEIHKIFGAIAAQVQKQSPDSDIKSSVKTFKSQLSKNAPLIPATIKRLLQQLSDLQKQALEDSPKSSSGFLGKLFKDSDKQDKTVSDPNGELSGDSSSVEDADWEEMEEGSFSIEGEILSEELETRALDRERALPETMLEDRYKDENSPEVPDRVSIILVELLDNFKTVATAEHKASKARQRIAQGLKWFELAPTLEDIRDFLLQAYIGADNEYRTYLEHLYGELTELLTALGVSIEAEQTIRQAATAFQNNVNDGVVSLSQALANNKNIEELKTAVASHLEQLQHALINFKQESMPPNDTQSLAVQLQSLVSKVQQMEANDVDIRLRLEEQKQRALTDTLTGLPNREAYNVRVYEEIERWQRYKHPLSMAVVDIDYFKKINDSYGHQTGDKVLKIVAGAIAKKLRAVDFMARFGGEEFVLLLPETNAQDASQMLNRIREALAKAPFRYKNEKLTITVSIGISQFQETDNADLVFVRADEALYEAKEGGRNCCKVKLS